MWSLQYILSVLMMVSSGSLPQSKIIQDRLTGDWPPVQGFVLPMIQESLQHHDPTIGQALGKMYGIDIWMNAL